jgi:pyridoxal phosphate enzyme (YggS family)
MDASLIKENYFEVLERVESAALKSGRVASDITLVAVSKTRTPEEVAAAIFAGSRDLGENKVQEIEAKYDAVTELIADGTKDEPVRWHMIGHLQRNKVKGIIDKVALIHSVDSYRLAEEIDKQAAAIAKVQDVLIQVNAANEESKFGIGVTETLPLVNLILEGLPNIRIRGVMNIAPIADDLESLRPEFSKVREVFSSIKGLGTSARLAPDILSMGMTQDFEVAIEEGSNLVRVGTGIFGPRIYM